MSQATVAREPLSTVAELLDALAAAPDLTVDADLSVTLDGQDLAVYGYGDLVALDCPSVGALRPLLARHGDQTMDLAAGLDATGLTAELRVRGAPVARLGADADPSSVARLLGLGPIEVLYDGLLLALVRRRLG